MAVAAVNDGLFRLGGMYGAAYRDGVQLAEVTEVTATVELNRIEVPLVGQTKQGYKPGRESREGTMRIQKIDSAWEMELYQFLSVNLEERRARRDRGEQTLRPFQLQLKVDDPDALGVETWQLDGVLIWRMSIGFSITDDILDREIPITWERETPIAHFKRTGGLAANGLPAVTQVRP